MSAHPSRKGAPARIGILVPARNESLLLGRKCRNLARLVWPTGGQPHRVVIVDDASDDGTGDLALELLKEARQACPEVEWQVVKAHGLGKTRAIQVGLAALGQVDLILLTDVDVVLREGSLIALTEAFREDPSLALACGAQEFVRDLNEDGSTRAADGGPPQQAGELFDRITAKVRTWESQSGRVFSVHGQLLVWRSSLGLAPTPGFEADDIDLMFAVRAAGGRVRLIQGARFLEIKPTRKELRRGQRRRRAAGYFQVLEAWSSRHPLGRSWRDRAQWGFYAWVPGLAPYLLAAALIAALGFGFMCAAWRGVAGAAILLGLTFSTRAGREVVGLALVIDSARRSALRTRGDPGDRWEPPRSRQ